MENSNMIPVKIDVKADSKDVADVTKKLIDTIKAPFSWWAKRREPIDKAKAETEAMLIRAQAIEPLAESLGITKEDATALVLRSEQREYFEKVRHQKNIENIAQQASEMLPHEVSDEPVDPDWTADFLENCKNVSNEEMQSIWARILAGEVAQPGSFSKRTLAFVKTLSKQEAFLFTKFCNLLWHHPVHNYLHLALPDNTLRDDFGISYLDLTELDSLSLIKHDSNTNLNWESPDVSFLRYFEVQFFLYPKIPNGKISINIIPLTKLGASLMPIAGATRNENYLNACLEQFSGKNVFPYHLPPIS